MENKGRKMLALGIVAMLCAVAIIGIGYAAFSGTAKTYNENNVAGAEYLKLDNSAWTPMVNTSFEYNYYDAQAGDVWYLTGTTTPVNSIYSAKAVGSALTLTLTNKTASSIASVDFTVTTVGTVNGGDFKCFLGVTVAGVEQFIMLNSSSAQTIVINDFATTTEGADPLGVNGTADITLQLYLGYEANKYIPESFIGNVVNPADKGANDIPGRLSENGPVGISDMDLGFSVKEHVSP